MKGEDMKRLKELESENRRLKKDGGRASPRHRHAEGDLDRKFLITRVRAVGRAIPTCTFIAGGSSIEDPSGRFRPRERIDRHELDVEVLKPFHDSM
jgi:hypothetical protein